MTDDRIDFLAHVFALLSHAQRDLAIIKRRRQWAVTRRRLIY